MAQTFEQLQQAAKLANAQLAAAQAAAAAELKAKTQPRTPNVILTDIFTNIASRLGNRPDLRLLITEFKAATAPAPAPAGTSAT